MRMLVPATHDYQCSLYSIVNSFNADVNRVSSIIKEKCTLMGHSGIRGVKKIWEKSSSQDKRMVDVLHIGSYEASTSLGRILAHTSAHCL